MDGPRGVQQVAFGARVGAGVTAQNFESVDLGVWAAQFLAAVDLYLTPQYSVPLAQLAGPTGLQAINRLIEAKETLADKIADTVAPILQGPTGATALADSREAVRQRLLVNLTEGFGTNSVLWSPFTVTGPTAFAEPPRLSGKPVSLGQAKPAATGGSGPSGPTGTVYSLSTAKIPLEKNSAASVLLNVQNASEHKNLDLDLDFVVYEMEHNIRDVPGVTGYQASEWLTFVLPPGSTGPAGSSQVHLDTDIGELEVPVPLRAYPVPPTMVAQAATATYRGLTGTAAQQIERAKRWDYLFSYRALSAEQDTDYMTVAFNERVDPNASLLRAGGRDLFDWLAQFISVFPEIQSGLAGVSQGAAGPEASQAISVMANLASQIAATWQAYPPVGPSRVLPPGMTAELYSYRLDTTRDQATQTLKELTLLRLDSAPVDIGWPAISVVGPSGSTALQVQSTKPDRRVYEYPPGVPATAPVTQSFRFSELDVIELTSAWAGVAVTRNEFLLGPTGPVTNPGFVYRTPLVRFISTQVPSLFWNEQISIPEAVGITGPASLPAYFSPLLRSVFEWDKGSTRPWPIKLSAKYGYELVENLQSFAPILLHPAFNLSPAGAGPQGAFVSRLSAGLTGWAAKNDPSANHGTFSLDLSAFAPGITGGQGITGARPVLEFADLALPLDDVSGFTGASGPSEGSGT